MSCLCFLNHFPLNKQVCQSIPVLPTCFQLALLSKRNVQWSAILTRFYYFRFHWCGLKIFNLLNFGNKYKYFQYHRLMIMCINPYIVKFSITMHRPTPNVHTVNVWWTFCLNLVLNQLYSALWSYTTDLRVKVCIILIQ